MKYTVPINALDEFRESMLQRGLRWLIEHGDVTALWKKVRGFFRYDDRVFYVDPTQHRHQQTHLTYHEAYHAIDPVHKENSYLIHVDTDETLAPWVKSKMEMEANLGASLIRFQGDRFRREGRDLPTSMETICYLADRFDASIHATLRRYVEDDHDTCIMLVFNAQPKITSLGEPFYTLRYYLPSVAFERQFNILWPDALHPDHWMFHIVNGAKPRKPSFEERDLRDSYGSVIPVVAQGFHNTYEILTFVYRRPKRTPKTRVIFEATKQGGLSTLVVNVAAA